MADPLKAFKAARLFLPQYVKKIKPEFAALDSLSVTFWKDNSTTLPHWSNAAKMVLLIQQSSDAAERVFSIFKNSYGDQQLSYLEDNVEASVMIQY